jgi:hypothetical protein
MLFVFIVIDISVAMGRYSEMTNAAKEGARLGATGADTSDIVARVDAQSFGLMDGATASCPANDHKEVCVQWIGGPGNQPAGQVGSYIKVTARYEYGFITPVFNGSFFGIVEGGIPDSLNITSCSVMRLERPVPGAPSSGGASPEC